jgi:hypothetical protein
MNLEALILTILKIGIALSVLAVALEANSSDAGFIFRHPAEHVARHPAMAAGCTRQLSPVENSIAKRFAVRVRKCSSYRCGC